MKNKFGNLIIVLIVMFFSFKVYASCTYTDIHEMHFDEKMTRSEIKEECSGEVTIPSCRFNKAYRLIKKDYSEEEITKMCSNISNNKTRICQTATWWCTMNIEWDVGKSCTCVDGYGRQYPGTTIKGK